MRGIFAAGVLDAFLRERFNPFDILIGVSSGAVTLASYLSGQRGRYFRIITGPMRRAEFLSPGRFLRGGHLMDLDWLWAHAAVHDPLDTATATSHAGKAYLVTATDVQTGAAVFLEPSEDNLTACLKASCALPVMYRGFVSLGGRLLADGGVADPIPVEETYRRGCRDITVIRTRARTSPKGFLLDRLLAWLFLRGYPGLKAGIRGMRRRYGDAVLFTRRPPADARSVEVAPPVGLQGARLSMDVDAIRFDYGLGARAGEEYLSRFA
jgi:predicted patatin/cPLA2 family phospholipase